MADCVQARITAHVKSALQNIRKSNGYRYDVGAVEQARKFIQINGRWDFILLAENEPVLDDEKLEIQELDFSVWFFPSYNDMLTGVPTTDQDTEIAHYCRNIDADVVDALQVDGTRGGLAAKTECTPMGNMVYTDAGVILYGSLTEVVVTTKIDNRDHYNIK